jgi:3-hydroxy-D-aspartate aldolase
MIHNSLSPNAPLIGKPGSADLIGTPALVLDLNRLDANISALAAHAREHGYGVRPPAKIHKSVEIARRQVRAGALGQCCSTLFEAEVMIKAGIPGVMLFTTVVTEPKLDRLARLNSATDQLSVVTDHEGNLEQLETAARNSGRPLAVLVEYEIGAGRTGVPDAGTALHLVRRIADSPDLEFAGIQGYVGLHQAMPSYTGRAEQSRRYVEPLQELVALLTAEGLPPPIVTGGGTGTHDIDPRFNVYTEIQAGSYIFGDVYYQAAELREDGSRPFLESLHVRATVISAAQQGFVITDCGAKELNGLTGPISPVVTGGAPAQCTYSIVGDDMGRIDFARTDDSLAVGQVVEILPPLCFQTILHHPAYHCVEGDTLVDIWPVDALPNW